MFLFGVGRCSRDVVQFLGCVSPLPNIADFQYADSILSYRKFLGKGTVCLTLELID